MNLVVHVFLVIDHLLMSTFFEDFHRLLTYVLMWISPGISSLSTVLCSDPTALQKIRFFFIPSPPPQYLVSPCYTFSAITQITSLSVCVESEATLSA